MTQRIVTIGPFTRIIQNSFLQQSIMLILAGMETSIIKYLGVKQKIMWALNVPEGDHLRLSSWSP